MACGNGSNRNQVYLPLQFNPCPAIFNSKEGTISFLPRSQPTNKFNTRQSLPLENRQVLATSFVHQSSGEKSKTIQGSLPIINHLSVNELSMIKNSNSLHHQLSSDRNGVVHGFPPSTNQLPANGLSIAKHSNSLHHQLSSDRNGMVHGFPPSANQLLANGLSTAKNSNSLHHLSSDRNGVVHGFPPSTNQLPANGLSTAKNSNSLHHQLSSVRNGVVHGFPPSANQLPANGLSTAKNSNSLHHQLSSGRNGVVHGFPPSTNQLPVNRSNVIQYPNLQYDQMSCNRTQMTQGNQPVTDRLREKETIIPQHSYDLTPQLGIGMNQDSTVLLQQSPENFNNMSVVNYSKAFELFQNEFRGNQEKDLLAYQKYDGESAMRQGLISIFQRPSTDGLDKLHNPVMPSHEISGRQFSYPSTNKFPSGIFNVNQDFSSVCRDPSQSDLNLNQNFSHYTEIVHICVIGPPKCGKDKLIRTFVRNENIRILKDKPLKFVVRQGMVSFGMTLKIDIWCAEELTPAIPDLRSLCGDSKSAIVLVYSIAQRCALLEVDEWIKLLKRDLGIKVPIILVGNRNDVGIPIPPNRLDDGIRLAKDNDLAAFYDCSTECVQKVEEIFLFSALKAFLSGKCNK